MFAKKNTVLKGFSELSSENKTATLLCPTSVISAKLINKYIKILFHIRKQLDEGVPILHMGYESGTIYENEFFNDSTDDDSDTDEPNQ